MSYMGALSVRAGISRICPSDIVSGLVPLADAKLKRKRGGHSAP
jgi:hypothetical protein